uniref:Uncharacterized protein n=1 Tax=Tetraselmis sp. GSL018 TaxID=582737 RepID=A0A061R332_9CHLO
MERGRQVHRFGLERYLDRTGDEIGPLRDESEARAEEMVGTVPNRSETAIRFRGGTHQMSQFRPAGSLPRLSTLKTARAAHRARVLQICRQQPQHKGITRWLPAGEPKSFPG